MMMVIVIILMVMMVVVTGVGVVGGDALLHEQAPR
jgi:hypothetical protein